MISLSKRNKKLTKTMRLITRGFAEGVTGNFNVLCIGAVLVSFIAIPANCVELRAQDNAPQRVQALATAAGRYLGSKDIANSVSVGKITLWNVTGPSDTFDITVYRLGRSQALRIITMPGGEQRQGTDGKGSWESSLGFSREARGRALYAIEELTTRSVESLIQYQALGLSLKTLGTFNGQRIVEANDGQGRETRYYIDEGTDTVSKLEAITGVSKSAVGGTPILDTDSLTLKDYRQVDGVLTPFRMERSINGVKIEEIQFSSVEFNVQFSENVFRAHR